jgi:hypothetical protein
MFVDQNIMNYKNRFATNYRIYNRLAFKKEPIISLNIWLQVLQNHKALNTIVIDAYDFNKEQNYSTSEIFNQILTIDSGKLFTIALIRVDLDLQTTGLIDEYVTKYEQSLLEKQTETNTCKIISKKYITLEELEEDNDKPIYYDPEFDKTNYSFIKKFKTEKNALPPDEFKELLQTKLVEDVNLEPDAAIQEANSILLGKKIVETGDYAILTLIDPEIQKQSAEYFVRKDNKWIKAEDIIGDVVIKDNKLFCNLQKECINMGDPLNPQPDECTSFNVAKAQINEETLKAIYKEFDETYGDKEDDLREKIDEILELSIIRTRYLKRIEQAEFFKYNNLNF